jgi:hypothetical protein
MSRQDVLRNSAKHEARLAHVSTRPSAPGRFRAVPLRDPREGRHTVTT